MPPWPMAMPSSTAIVLNSRPIPPASKIEPATSWPRSLRWTCPGTNWVKLLALATIGLPKSSSVLPVAGLGAGVCGLAGTALVLSLDNEQVTAGRLAPFAAGQVLGAVLLVVGLLRLPGAADPRGAALRQVLDGALLAACALHISWTLFIQ